MIIKLKKINISKNYLNTSKLLVHIPKIFLTCTKIIQNSQIISYPIHMYTNITVFISRLP